MEDINKLWEEDSKPEINDIKNDTLKDVSFWAQEQLRIQDEIVVAEEALADLKLEFKDISQQKLPDAMRECNLAEIKLSDGSKVNVSILEAVIKQTGIYAKSRGGRVGRGAIESHCVLLFRPPLSMTAPPCLLISVNSSFEPNT